MLIKREILERIKCGEIKLQFRRWRRRTIRPGGTLKTAVGVLQIGAITPTSADLVTDADARDAGFADRADFLRWLDMMKPGELDRIEVSYLGEDPRIALRMDTNFDNAALAQISHALDKIDSGAYPGWCRDVLALIAERPGELAEALAEAVAMEKAAFKPRVRLLKELGLTESLDTGYRLSPRGQAVFDRIAK